MNEQEDKQTKDAIKHTYHRMNVYLPSYLYNLLKVRARQNHENMSSYIRLCILAIEENNITDSRSLSVKKQNKDKIDYQNLTYQLSKIGTNLNQISRKANSGLDINDDLRDFVDEYSDKINDLLEKMSE